MLIYNSDRLNANVIMFISHQVRFIFMHEKGKFAKFNMLFVVGSFLENGVDLFLFQMHTALDASSVKLNLIQIPISLSVEKLKYVLKPFIMLLLREEKHAVVHEFFKSQTVCACLTKGVSDPCKH